MQKEIPAFVVLLVGLVWTPEISEKRRLKVGSHVFFYAGSGLLELVTTPVSGRNKSLGQIISVDNQFRLCLTRLFRKSASSDIWTCLSISFVHPNLRFHLLGLVSLNKERLASQQVPTKPIRLSYPF